MHERTSRTDLSTAALKPWLASSGASQTAPSEWKETFNPCTLGLILLAVAVALFNYNYKVSLYSEHPTKGFPVAKALVEHRTGDGSTSVHRLRHRTRFQFEVSPDDLLTRVKSSIPGTHFDAPRFFAAPRALPFFDSALPLRSPPIFAA